MTWLKDPKVAALMAKTSPDLVSAPGQTSRTFPVWLNMKAKPLDDVRVRRALSLATDRKACLDTVLGGSGKVGAMIPESQVGGYDGVGEMPYYKHDPAAAKKLLAEAGYPDGHRSRQLHRRRGQSRSTSPARRSSSSNGRPPESP